MRAMKDSGVDWLGEIPADWSLRPLWSVYRRVKRTGFSDELLLSVYRDHGVIPKASRDDNHNVESLDLSTYQLVERSDLAVNKMKAWQGSLSVSGFRGIVSPAYFVFKLQTKGVHTGYLHYLLRSNPYVLSYLLSSKGVRIGQWDLQPEIFRRTPVLLPPLREQEAISRYIDQETSQIDLLISKKEQLIEKLLERRQALITHVVTKGLDPNAPMKDSGVEWFTKMPGHWEVRRVGQLGKLSNGHPFDSEAFDRVGTIPLIRIRDIGNSEFSTFVKADVVFPDSTLLRDGDVVIGMDGEFNAVYWNRGRAALNQRLCYLRFRDASLARFVSFAVSTPLRRINEITYSTTVKHLSSGQVAKISLAIPPDEELKSSVEYLEAQTASIDTLIARAGRASELLKERRQALITQVVAGKIDVRGFAGGNS